MSQDGLLSLCEKEASSFGRAFSRMGRNFGRGAARLAGSAVAGAGLTAAEALGGGRNAFSIYTCWE
jgi:hypothetical protein